VSEPNVHRRFVAAAHALAIAGRRRFTLTELYAEAGLTRIDFRRTFGTKAALLEACADLDLGATQENHVRSTHGTSANDERWLERRFRIVERAISSLECQLADVRNKKCITSVSGRLTADSIPPKNSAPAEQYIEPPPFIGVQNDSLVSQSHDATTADDEEPPLVATPTSHGEHELDSYWAVASEQLETRPYKTVQLFLAAIMCGILIGIATSTMHTGSSVPASAPFSMKTPNTKHPRPYFHSLFERANRGDVVAQRQLALAYVKGAGMQPDFGNGLRWATVAASGGDADAAFLLGSLYETGMLPDLGSAAHWYLEAAKRGNVQAMHNFGIALLNGSGVRKDSTAAVRWFERAANLGYRDSEFDLAVLYERGEGVDQNPPQALRWYEKAASVGDAEAAKRAAWLEKNVPGLAGFR
jgi:TPR repeat protein